MSGMANLENLIDFYFKDSRYMGSKTLCVDIMNTFVIKEED